MSMMCLKEGEGWRTSERMAIWYLEREEEFLRKHILNWVPKFCEIIERENDGFYSLIAKLTNNWIYADFHNIKELLKGVEVYFRR